MWLIIFEEKGWKLEILFLNSVESTHIYLKDYIKQNTYKNPISVVTTNQTSGIGSRDNKWEGKQGNLFFSFVLDKSLLPFDLPMQSFSIYFSYLLKMVLEQNSSQVWLKWPNDFYIKEKKVGGTITNISSDLVYCGIGLNLKHTQEDYGSLDIVIDYKILLDRYFSLLKTKPLWKQIFSNYLVEFENSKQFKTTINNKKVSLENSILNNDGSITIDDKKVYSLR